MPSYGYNPAQDVALNQGAIFNTIVGCPSGKVWHEDGTASIILRGCPMYPCRKSAKYQVTALANIGLPTGADLTQIAIGLVQNGEVRGTTIAMSSPSAVNEYNQVTVSDIIEVPRGLNFTISLQNVPASTATGYTPADSISMQNLNLYVKEV